MCWFKEAFLPSAFIIFVSLITSTRCDSFINAIEGESVNLHFPYPCDSFKITLQYANRRPFYDSANPEFLELNPDQSETFTVKDTTEEEEDHCFLQLSVDPVKRFDGGTYILLTHTGDYITRIGLHVDFLPGVAHCSFGGSHDHAGDWERLDCKATVGSMLGQIQCYQMGIRMPYLDAPSENDKTLKQTILVRQNRHQVYCCSSQLIEPKERCGCNDSVWDPFSQGEVHNPGDTCPTTTHAPTVPLTTTYHHDHTSLIAKAIVPTKCEILEEIYPLNILLIVLVTDLLVLLIPFIIYKIIYLAQSKLMNRRITKRKEVAETTCV